MKLISWNVNGLRACLKKNFMEDFERLDADIFCLQETKLSEARLSSILELCPEEGVFRHCGIHKAGAAVCGLWDESVGA